MPGLFWLASYAQSRPNRSYLAVVSIQVCPDGTDPENGREGRYCSSGMTNKNLFLSAGVPQRHQLKDLKCRINGGSGFPAAICINGVKTIRGWKAAPTINKLYTLKTIGFFHIVLLLLWQFFCQRYLNYLWDLLLRLKGGHDVRESNNWGYQGLCL